MHEYSKKNININGSMNGIANFGDNSINININGENTTTQLNDNKTEKVDIANNNNTIEQKKDKFSSSIVKTMIEIIVGVIISVIAGYILYKLNMN